jgi:hypothetical protein
MNKAVKWIAAPVLGLLTLAGGGIGYLYGAFPQVAEAKAGSVEPTPELRERGKYLAEHVALCGDCHAERDFSRFSGPTKPGTAGKGGERWGRDMGLPGEIHAKNITPAALGEWSDGEIMRAMTTGVSRDGTPLFPLMPYPAYRHLCESDAKSLVTWVRGLEPIEHQVPERELDFPLNLIVRTIPAQADPWECPTPKDGTRYGEYLVTMASCGDCHTQQKEGKPVPGMGLAGGFAFPLPSGGTVRSANITPHETTGIGKWTREAFVQRFKAMAQPGAAHPVGPGSFNTIMPWTQYAGMTEQDLGAVYDYLRTVPPVDNKVEPFTAAL